MAPAELLDWDSAFFGVRIARAAGSKLTRAGVKELLDWCFAQKVDCLYFAADLNDPETLTLAEACGFSMKDVRMTLARSLSPGERFAAQLRDARAEDAAALEAIAASAHGDSRFYFDRRFPRDRVDEMFRVWIRTSMSGTAGAVLVASDGDDRAIGYVTCDRVAPERGRIGLIAVAESARGRRIGGQLVEAALEWFCRQGMTEASVVTQARNLPALRLYQRAGFVIRAVDAWYHLWLDNARYPV
jgi:dTDP-4-amino-4,6-dideoxy-D-galactose acyltransferase